jgi:hypothetical protein
MKEQLFIATAAAMLLSCPCRGWSSERQSSITTEICKLENDANRAVIAHDRGFLTALFADEYQHTNFFGSVADKNAEVDFFPQRISRSKARLSLSVLSTSIRGRRGDRSEHLDRRQLPRKEFERIVPIHPCLCTPKRPLANRSLARQQNHARLICSMNSVGQEAASVDYDARKKGTTPCG